ncbi:ubiquinone biosynthesis monooxygenase COQ6, mitochondrial [Aricia agestis]|uniref:ubiquinone biosynthesis monooxygenase COQ6, mitochondrial n=1 Tax=Aricia agestis TaxID=91739 RepID=UPI001C20AA37|nr:ubiquinone biosynthesis monooxygenase COQ6, mitochondrial [Aricia agestis]XP_041968959.1 ubiquinone biosynthesis monooxygenase COQ6, mitochondrial [Aricia agestis]
MIRNLSKYNNLVIISIKNNAKSIAAVRRYSNQNYEQSRTKYDVVIAGGGMVGCTLACALGKMSLLSNLKVLLLEGSPDKPYQLPPEYSNRVVALSQNTKSLMSSLSVWQHLEKMRVNPVRHMQVWDACSDALISFSSADIMNDDVAYIVENDVLLHAVNTELKSNSVQNVDIVYGAKIVGYELPKTTSGNEECLVKMDDGKSYTCNLLIGADGAKSAVREAMGVQYVSWDYDHMGIVATLHLAEESENNMAWQRFLPTGPIALLPLDSTRSSLVWSTSPAHARELLKLPEESFVDALNDALWKQYPRNSAVDAATTWVASWLRRAGYQDGAARQLPPSVRAITPRSRAAFPFGFGHSTRYVAPGVALIGDAAHRVHPLAGQGVNLGFGDVRDLTSCLADALYAGLDINDPSWLSKYESTRQRHNVPTQLAIDALYRLYRADLPPLVLARSVGLQLTNALHPLKKFIISHATT